MPAVLLALVPGNSSLSQIADHNSLCVQHVAAHLQHLVLFSHCDLRGRDASGRLGQGGERNFPAPVSVTLPGTSPYAPAPCL